MGSTLYKNFPKIFQQKSEVELQKNKEEQERLERVERKARKAGIKGWGGLVDKKSYPTFYTLVYYLADGDITKFDTIYNMNHHTVFLTYEHKIAEQKRIEKEQQKRAKKRGK